MGTVTEQLLYEIGDPSCYTLPDVVCDWRFVSLEQVGVDRVRVLGARGQARPEKLKLSCTAMNGYMLSGHLVIPGAEHEEKAQCIGEAIIANGERALSMIGLPPLQESLVEVLGGAGGRESVLRISMAHDNSRALGLAALEIAPAALSMGAGIAGLGGVRKTHGGGEDCCFFSSSKKPKIGPRCSNSTCPTFFRSC